MTARARVSSSRKDMYSVMANSGFGDLEIKKHGATIVIPNKLLNKSSHKPALKKCIQKRVKELTRENAEWLEKKGIAIYLG